MAVRQLRAELVVPGGAVLGEGPRWDARAERLVWVDITGRTIHLFDPVTGSDVVHAVPVMVGAALPRASSGYVLATDGGFATWTPGGELDFFAVPEQGERRRANDAACDPAGNLLAGTTSLDDEPAAGRLYRVGADRGVALVKDGIGLPNGIDWSPDGATLYFTDSSVGRVDAYRYDPQVGVLGAGRPAVVPADGVPDGHTVDADGNLWVALWSAGRVACFTPDGRELVSVTVPVAALTSCAFGGVDLSTLFITTMAHSFGGRPPEPESGALFACDVGAVGRPPHVYAS